MKPRYNLRVQSNVSRSSLKRKISPSSSGITKMAKSFHSNSVRNQQNRRQSLRLTQTTKDNKSSPVFDHTTPSHHPVKDNHQDEDNSIRNDDDYDELLARHHRHMLEEQKDRKLYERYVRGQRTLRRLQCRRTHTAHLNEATRNRLLRELKRERRYDIHDKICNYLANHSIVFQHGSTIESKEPINWSNLEEEIPHNRNIGPIHELDVMIENLQNVIKNSKSSTSKPRLSVHERRKQRLTATNSPDSTKTDNSHSINTSPTFLISNPSIHISTQIPIESLLPRIPVVRFIDDQNNKIPISNSQHLTCIQNVLLHHNNKQSNVNNHSQNINNEISTSNTMRQLVLRSKSTHTNLLDSSPTRKRPVEKENYGVVTNSSNHILRNASPYVTADDDVPCRSSLFSIEWCRSNIPRLLRRLVPIQTRGSI